MGAEKLVEPDELSKVKTSDLQTGLSGLSGLCFRKKNKDAEQSRVFGVGFFHN